jgi:hypothetical protein
VKDQTGYTPAGGGAVATTLDTLVKGKPTRLQSIGVGGKQVVITGRLFSTAKLADEWYEDVDDPEAIVERLKQSKARVDIFSFWQRLPDTTPRYDYHMEPESIAVLPVTTVDDWFKTKLNPKARNLLRKSAKMGVAVTAAGFDDDFVNGMTEIFNETPIRQDKPFWHFGKDRETIRREFSKYLFREDLYGAYHERELIGFIFLADAGRYGVLGQIISKVAHRDKAPNNALIAKAVEVCASRNVPYLVYSNWSEGNLGHFKRQNGFEKVDLPRYYVPLTVWGRIVLKLGLHHGLAGVVPERFKRTLVNIRSKWYADRSRSARSTPSR